MAYTLSTLRQDVRDYLDDDEYDAGLIDLAINNYQQELFAGYNLRLAETEATVALNSSSSTAPLPSDWAKNLGLYIVTTEHERDLTTYEIETDLFVRTYLDTSPDVGTPLYWCVQGTNFRFDKPADVDYTLKALYLKWPTYLVNDADVPLVPEQFKEMMKLGAIERLFRREDEYGLSNSERTVLQGQETNFIMRYGRGRTSAKPHVMRRA